MSLCTVRAWGLSVFRDVSVVAAEGGVLGIEYLERYVWRRGYRRIVVVVAGGVMMFRGGAVRAPLRGILDVVDLQRYRRGGGRGGEEEDEREQ